MLCQKCGKHPATTYVKRTVNGVTSEYRLCASCATGMGGFDLGSFWGSLFAEPSARHAVDTVRCSGCGKTFREIAASGKAGCPACYTTFYDRLLPSVQRIHGKTGHVGKIPSGAESAVRTERELEDLRRQLNEAITAQEYEKCADLRDRIRALEGGVDHA